MGWSQRPQQSALLGIRNLLRIKRDSIYAKLPACRPFACLLSTTLLSRLSPAVLCPAWRPPRPTSAFPRDRGPILVGLGSEGAVPPLLRVGSPLLVITIPSPLSG